MADRRDSLTTIYQISVPVLEQDPEDYGISPDATDGIGSIEFTKEVDSGYYGMNIPKFQSKKRKKKKRIHTNSVYSQSLGPSSNIAFTRNIRRALYALLSRQSSRQQAHPDARSYRVDIPHRPSLDVSRPSTPTPNGQTSRPPAGESGNLETGYDYLRLPPDDEMDALVTRFFVDTGILFPFVHNPTFMDTYNRVKANNFRKFRRSWLGLLNAILAMATVTSASSNITAIDRAAKAELFYMRAKTLCLDQMFNGATLETGKLKTPIYWLLFVVFFSRT